MRFLLAALLVSLPAAAEPESWSRPYPAHTVTGNLHYVGTEDLACFLITTPKGHILINTGLAGSAPQIRASVEKLGYRVQDIRILLTMQAHFDHVGAMRDIQRASGAELFATEADAPLVESGGRADPMFDEAKTRFEPVTVARRLRDGEVVELGGTTLRVHLTPGHSPGSVTYTMRTAEGEVAIANMMTVVMPLAGNTKYPSIVADFERSFAVQKALRPDIWVAAHASQYGMQAKHRRGSFRDPEGYRAAVARHERQFGEQLEQEKRRR